MTNSLSLLLNSDGYGDIPEGKIASIVTYLEMKQAPARVGEAGTPRFVLERLDTDIARYRALFAEVGAPWLWFGRAALDDDGLRRIVAHPAVEAYAAVADGVDIALLELDFRGKPEVELAYFGLVPGMTGQGIGRALMNEAIRLAFGPGIERFFVHTCTLDDPAALAFYTRSGFTPYKQAIEIADDPRLKGILPLTCAPQVPLIPPRA